jgi:hypothetical protein
MLEVIFERVKGKVGATTYAKVKGQVVGTWEAPNLMLGVRTGTLLRPLRDGKLEVVRMGNWTKREWRRLVRDFANDDQRARKSFWACYRDAKVVVGVCQKCRCSTAWMSTSPNAGMCLPCIEEVKCLKTCLSK